MSLSLMKIPLKPLGNWKPPIKFTKSQLSALVITFPSYSKAVSSQIHPPTSLIVWARASEVPPALCDYEVFPARAFAEVVSPALGTKERRGCNHLLQKHHRDSFPALWNKVLIGLWGELGFVWFFPLLYVSVVNLYLIYRLEVSKRHKHIFSSCNLPSKVLVFHFSISCFASNCHLSCWIRTAGCPHLSGHHFESLAEALHRVKITTFWPMVMLVSACLVFHRCLTHYLT